MLARNVDVGAAYAALKLRPIAFNAVCMVRPAYPLVSLVIDCAVTIAAIAKVVISAPFVRTDCAAAHHISQDHGF